MNVLRSLALTIMIIIGVYVAVILSYLLVPMIIFGTVFLFVYTTVTSE